MQRGLQPVAKKPGLRWHSCGRHPPVPRKLEGNPRPEGDVAGGTRPKEASMRSILLWLLGIPIPIIILLLLFGVL